MSTPPENPNPGQPGEQPVQPPADPYQAPGYQAPQGVPPEQPAAPQQPYQQPGYQAPQNAPQQPYGQQPPQYPQGGEQLQYQQQPPQYQQPGQQQGQGNFQFQMPTDGPKSFDDVMPKGGFSGIFNVAGLPNLLKWSYILWLITAGLWLLTTIIGFIFSLTLLGRGSDTILGTLYGSDYWRGEGIKGIIFSIIALVVIAAIVVCAMKLKEGLQWPRLALTIIAAVSIILAIFGGGGVGLIGIVATVLMWLPESTAWLNSRRSAPPVV